MTETLLLDGSKMKAEDFYAKFDEFVGMPHNDWDKLPTTKHSNSSETFYSSDGNFIYAGSFYSAPVLLKIEYAPQPVQYQLF
jgi:hypothetical protein